MHLPTEATLRLGTSESPGSAVLHGFDGSQVGLSNAGLSQGCPPTWPPSVFHLKPTPFCMPRVEEDFCQHKKPLSHARSSPSEPGEVFSQNLQIRATAKFADHHHHQQQEHQQQHQQQLQQQHQHQLGLELFRGQGFWVGKPVKVILQATPQVRATFDGLTSRTPGPDRPIPSFRGGTSSFRLSSYNSPWTLALLGLAAFLCRPSFPSWRRTMVHTTYYLLPRPWYNF